MLLVVAALALAGALVADAFASGTSRRVLSGIGTSGARYTLDAGPGQQAHDSWCATLRTRHGSASARAHTCAVTPPRSLGGGFLVDCRRGDFAIYGVVATARGRVTLHGRGGKVIPLHMRRVPRFLGFQGRFFAGMPLRSVLPVTVRAVSGDGTVLSEQRITGVAQRCARGARLVGGSFFGVRPRG
jgi:hypothetical protein